MAGREVKGTVWMTAQTSLMIALLVWTGKEVCVKTAISSNTLEVQESVVTSGNGAAKS